MLRSCVSGARILVYPSLYEGFGLPPLEAASAGVPSVVTPAGALLEIYGDVAEVSDGFDGPSIAAAIKASLDSHCDTDELQRFAGRFSISAMTRNVCSVYGEFEK
jgi:alpha-1,3-rhamnosyl/mannosyltransferase